MEHLLQRQEPSKIPIHISDTFTKQFKQLSKNNILI